MRSCEVGLPFSHVAGGWVGGGGGRGECGEEGGERVRGGGAELLTPALVPGYRGGRRRRRRKTEETVERKKNKTVLTGGKVVPKPAPSHTGK